MCGIVGVLALNKKSIKIENIKLMADKISHRGPDDAGYLCLNTNLSHNIENYFLNFTEKKFFNKNKQVPTYESNFIQKKLNSHNYNLYMGHRRLAIIDTSYAGHQPMSDSSNQIWITYNGEIYNYKSIRGELKKLGYIFKSNTDTEVIIYAYKEWGIKFLNRLNGMFAFSIYDNFKKKFYLCRDRYGIKPVYYYMNKDKLFVYGSEIKSILAYEDVKTEIDKSSLVEYFTFQNFFTNKTLHKSILILEAGNYIEIDLNSNKIEKNQYWDFNFHEPEFIKDEREYIEELNRLVIQAVKRNLLSDVPVGSYLSGGIDSTSIVAIASEYFKKKNDFLKTFTVGFDLSSINGIELTFDERSKAKYISDKFKTEHYETILQSGDMERCLPILAYHLEEPRVGQSYPNYYASKMASKFVKVVLSGAGGDELFAGYPWRYYKTLNNKNFEEYIDKYYTFWQRLIPNKNIKELFYPISDETKDFSTKDIFKKVFKHQTLPKTQEDYINCSLYFEAKTFLHGLLVVEDKLSMSHSLETRVPFLDNDLVDFAQKIPVRYKLNNLDNVIKQDENEINKIIKFKDGKTILRKVLAKYIPYDVNKSIKKGFSGPDKSWFKGKSIEFVKSKLFENDLKIYQYLDKKTVQKLVNEHISGKKNRRLLIWSLINFSEWIKHFD